MEAQLSLGSLAQSRWIPHQISFSSIHPIRATGYKTLGRDAPWPSVAPPPSAMATADERLADTEKTSSRSTTVGADEAYVDPKGSETLHRGLNARQVCLAPSLLRFHPHAHSNPRFP